MHVTVGVGTRDYYRKMGYKLEGPYMVKILDPRAYEEIESSTTPVSSFPDSNSFSDKLIEKESIQSCLQEVMRNTKLRSRENVSNIAIQLPVTS